MPDSVLKNSNEFGTQQVQTIISIGINQFKIMPDSRSKTTLKHQKTRECLNLKE